MNSNKNDRRAALTDMWGKTALAILRVLDSEDPKSAALEVARKFLSDNNTTVDAIRDWRSSPLGDLARAMPKFDDDDETTAGPSAEENPLRVVPPFASTDSNDG